MIKIIIADDHRIFIDGVKSALQNVNNINIVGEALNGKQVLRLLDNLYADIVLLDINMPILDGLETAAIIQKQYKKVKTIILSTREKQVLNYLAKEYSSEEIADKLGIGYNSVRTYRERLMIKAGVRNTAGLIYWAVMNNIFE